MISEQMGQWVMGGKVHVAKSLKEAEGKFNAFWVLSSASVKVGEGGEEVLTAPAL